MSCLAELLDGPLAPSQRALLRAGRPQRQHSQAGLLRRLCASDPRAPTRPFGHTMSPCPIGESIPMLCQADFLTIAESTLEFGGNATRHTKPIAMRDARR